MPDNRLQQYVEMAVAASLLVFAAAAILFIIPSQVLPPKTVFGASANSASPAMVPYVLCTLILICSGAYLLRAFRNPKPYGEDGARAAITSYRTPAIVGLAVAYTLAFESVPFVVSTPIFLVSSYFVLDEFPPRLPPLRLALLVCGAIGFAVLLKTVFEQGFRIYLGG